MNKQWLVIRLSPGDYATMIGHSEKFVRSYCMPGKLRNDPGTMIEMKIPINDILANCYKLSAVVPDTKGE